MADPLACRRRMRLLGVQARHVASQLAWNVYVDEPGANLGLPQLIHVAKQSDAGEPLPPEAPVRLPMQATDFAFRFPYAMKQGAYDDNAVYRNGQGPDGRSIDYKRTLKPPAPLSGVRVCRPQLAMPGLSPMSEDWRRLL